MRETVAGAVAAGARDRAPRASTRSLTSVGSMARPPVIEYRGSHHFELAPEDLWLVLEDVERFEDWWPWLEQFSLEGQGLVAGAKLHGVVVPPLPYRMRIDVELLRTERFHAIDARIHGDLRGSAELRLEPDPGGTTAEVHWSVEMMQRPMRVASRFAHPLMCWGHDRVVEMTLIGFRRHVELRDRYRP